MISEFLQQLAPEFTGEELFDHISDVVYFIKNSQGEYLVVNKTLVARCEAPNKEALLGKTSAEVLRPPLGDLYAAQDQQVLKTGVPLVTQLELHLHPNGEVGWCLTTKLPLRNKRGKVIGLVGVSQDLRIPNKASEDYQQLTSAIEYAEKRLSKPPSVQELTRIAKMSRYQLDRRMRSVFGLVTGQWLIKIRLDAAQRLLQETDLPIVSIALHAGYSDQSAFTRQFHRATGLAPSDFRAARKRLP